MVIVAWAVPRPSWNYCVNMLIENFVNWAMKNYFVREAQGELEGGGGGRSWWSVQICGHLTNIIRGDRLSIVQRQVRNIYLPVSSDQLIFIFGFRFSAVFFPLSFWLLICMRFLCVSTSIVAAIWRCRAANLPQVALQQSGSPSPARCVPFGTVLKSTNCLSNPQMPPSPFSRHSVQSSVQLAVSPSVSQLPSKIDCTAPIWPRLVVRSMFWKVCADLALHSRPVPCHMWHNCLLHSDTESDGFSWSEDCGISGIQPERVIKHMDILRYLQIGS